MNWIIKKSIIMEFWGNILSPWVWNAVYNYLYPISFNVEFRREGW